MYFQMFVVCQNWLVIFVCLLKAEFLKKHVENEKEAGKYHEKIEISDNSKGNSYKKVLGRFLDEYVTTVEIEDPYIRSIHQVSVSIVSLVYFSTVGNLKHAVIGLQLA